VNHHSSSPSPVSLSLCFVMLRIEPGSPACYTYTVPLSYIPDLQLSWILLGRKR
jgi:hypothetical protein